MAHTSLLSRLLGHREDEHAAVRPLWHALVAAARNRAWYAEYGVADTLPGRFDAVTLTLSLALLRREHEEALKAPSVRLTELFVTDMDGQLRETGVGDMVVGKHIGRLMSVLGGRLGAYREALAQTDNAALEEALSRNISMSEGAQTAGLATAARAMFQRLEATPAPALLAGDFQ